MVLARCIFAGFVGVTMLSTPMAVLIGHHSTTALIVIALFGVVIGAVPGRVQHSVTKGCCRLQQLSTAIDPVS
jgi:hypothetical protein